MILASLLYMFLPCTALWAQPGENDAQSQEISEEPTNADAEKTAETTHDEEADIDVIDGPAKWTQGSAVKSPFLSDHHISVTLQTSRGDLCCELFTQDHPITVLNFLVLAGAQLPWTRPLEGPKPFYRNLPFHKRERNSFAATGKDQRGELPPYTIADERCTTHMPVAGALAMVQAAPGQSRSEFMVLAKDMPIFEGLFSIFGSCQPIEIIKELSNHKAELMRVIVHDRKLCEIQP
ncbi:MAG: peptidylprolyl isomerase [Bradymonadia bacterium]|jgi:cyclophilin family peptidyl-prolyl cis-trans isomerase